jgi:NADH-quinone oxidoreductase subunit L
MNNLLINIFIFIPFLGFVVSLLLSSKTEKYIARTAFLTSGLNLILFVAFSIYWISFGMPELNIKEIVLYETSNYEFFIDFYFDKITAVYMFVGSLLTFLITMYSKYYLHREEGFKRFFNTILLFYFGYVITIFSGNFETLFVGWEILGISSFLLIAFYRNRYLPVRNAVKVFSIYRIGDVGILLAMWASHHLWHENVTFLKLNNYELVHEHLVGHTLVGTFISIMILLAACAKSAQIPFSSWLPRAMEGPTPSSAIFYGSLSVHFGVFLLLRTYPFWENQIIVRILIGAVGLSSAVIGTLIARVQSSIKSQIAYASIAQIGLIFIELSFGLDYLALFHFAGNAFLRTYQLLVSPSIVSYLIKEQFYHFIPSTKSFENNLPRRLSYTTYVLGLKEWNLDAFMNSVIFRPLKKIGSSLNFLTFTNLSYFFIPAYLIGVCLWFYKSEIPLVVLNFIPEIFASIGLLSALKAFSERSSPRLAWLLLITYHYWVALAIGFNDNFEFTDTLLYLSGISILGGLGYLALNLLKKREKIHFSLNEYFGHAYEYPFLSIIVLLCGLGLMGFPISPSFIGEDLIFSHIQQPQIYLAFVVSLSFVVAGIAVVRIYARLFLGPHVKKYHSTSNKSS